MTVELIWPASDGPEGAVVGAVEIIDERLVTVTSTVLRAGRGVPVDLWPGRYLVQGWLPSGERVWTTFDVSATGRRTTVALDPSVTELEGHPGGWVRTWSYSGRTWSVDPVPTVHSPESGTVDVIPTPRSGGRRVALQVGGAGLAARITMVPVACPLRLAYVGTTWHVTPQGGTAATLLGYLHHGDLSSAHVVARQALQESPNPATVDNPFLALVIGYYLLRTGHELAHRWVSELAWAQPDSVDAAVLGACLMRRDHRIPVSTIVDTFLRAAFDGLPVVAVGLHMLIAGLACADGDDARAVLNRLRAYVPVLGDTPLTTFPGDDPSRIARLRLVDSGGDEPDDAASFPAHQRRQDVLPTLGDHVMPAGSGDRRRLREALRLVQAGGIGVRPKTEQVSAGDLVLAVTAREATESSGLDVEFDIRLPDTRRVSFTGLVIAIQVDLRLHCVSTIEGTGRCRFTDVPLGTWELTVRERTRGRHGSLQVPLPPPIETAMLATTAEGMPEVMRTLLPGDQGMVVLRRRRDDTYWLELLASGSANGTAVGVAYERADGEDVFRLIPVSAGSSGRSSSTLRLDGIDVRRPWHIAPDVDPIEVGRRSLTDVIESVGAAGSQETRDTWRALAWELPPDIATAVRTALDDAEGSRKPSPETEVKDAGPHRDEPS